MTKQYMTITDSVTAIVVGVSAAPAIARLLLANDGGIRGNT